MQPFTLPVTKLSKAELCWNFCTICGKAKPHIRIKIKGVETFCCGWCGAEKTTYSIKIS